MTAVPEPTPSPSPAAWSGMCYEDFEVDRIYRHRFGRTITDTDNVWFSLLTLGLNQVHFNSDYAGRTPFGKPIIPSPFTLAVITGISATDFGQNTVANLGWSEVKLPHPVLVGDTLYARTKVLAKRESASRPYAGIVDVKTEGYNQGGEIVITFQRTLMVYRRGHLPAESMPEPASSTL
jgi:acyl dehydratase